MLSQLDKQFLKKQLRILPTDPTKWHKQQYIRLLALLKFSEALQKQLLDNSLENNDIKNLTYLLQKLQPTITQYTYFPFHKLKYTINTIINYGEQDTNHSSVLFKNILQKNQQVNISEDAVKILIQNIDKLYDIQVIELSSMQIVNIFKNCKLQNYATVIKKFNIDGFNLICSLADWEILRGIKNYFKDQDIKCILEVSYLFLTQYYRLGNKNDLGKNMSNITKFQSQLLEKEIMSKIVKQITSQELTKKNSQDDIQIDFEKSEYGTSQMGQSQMGQSQMGQSQMGQSEIMGQSYYAQSVRQSVYAQSEYVNSVRGSVDCRISYRVANNYSRASLMYNSEIITELRQACLNVPFDLFNLQPLQIIKIRSLKTAFGREVDKDCWTFSVQGCKMGRQKQNDLRFPDQLSISGKHAQIIFKAQTFYLQDLGSKTGTYLRIQNSIPMQDEIYVQFSTQVEIVFRILKKQKNQGTIKAQIKKPQNLPDYKISLKQGYKIKIGRADRCHIRINSNTIFDKHSEIYFKDSTFYFKNCHPNYMSWLRLSAKSVRSQNFKLNTGDVFRLSSRKSFIVQAINNQLQKN